MTLMTSISHIKCFITDLNRRFETHSTILTFSYLINFLCILQIDQCKLLRDTRNVRILFCCHPKCGGYYSPNFDIFRVCKYTYIFMRVSEMVVQISDG